MIGFSSASKELYPPGRLWPRTEVTSGCPHAPDAWPAILTLTLLVASGIGATAAAPKPVTPCLTPGDPRVDLNACYGVSAAIIAPFCPELESGRAWTASAAWFVAPTHKTVPDGYVPVGVTPVDDFLAKFVAVEWEVDPGTAQEKSYVFGGTANLAVIPGDEITGINMVTVGTAKPLSVGPHEIVVFLTLTAQHCDGLGDVAAENCLPAGTSVFDQFAFDVIAGHHQ